MTKWELLARFLELKAEDAKLTARLWETDPEKFGADAASIAEENGMKAAFASAAALVREAVKDD